jgi:hypothetical protein
LLDSVVKEQLVKSFVSTEARILQHPIFPSSLVFEEFFFSSQPLALSEEPQAPRQREANSTAFQFAVNLHLHSLKPFDPSSQQDKTTTLPGRRILLESATAASFSFSFS